MEPTPSFASDETEAKVYANADELMPFFSAFNMSLIAIIVLVPLTLWTLKSTCLLYKNVPSAALKTPAILIFFGPLTLQICNMAAIHVESEHSLALISLAAKIFVTVLFCSFYFMIREVVFYEHLLQQTIAMNADAAFSETGTVSSSPSSQVSEGVFSLVPRELTGTSNNRRISALKE